MPSAIYRVFAQAMRERRPLVCLYQGYPRAICPIVLGHTDAAGERALSFQFAGSSSKGAVHGAWRCLDLAQVRNAEITDGPWLSGERHSQPQGCVRIVDLDVNPDSPYSPKRRL